MKLSGNTTDTCINTGFFPGRIPEIFVFGNDLKVDVRTGNLVADGRFMTDQEFQQGAAKLNMSVKEYKEWLDYTDKLEDEGIDNVEYSTKKIDTSNALQEGKQGYYDAKMALGEKLNDAENKEYKKIVEENNRTRTVNIEQLRNDALHLNQGDNTGLERELRQAINNINNNSGLDADTIRGYACVAASLYIQLRNSGANVGTFAEFFADNVNNGNIRGNDGFTTREQQDSIVSQYTVEGRNIELVRTTDYNEFMNTDQNFGIVRYSVHNGGHNLNVYRDGDDFNMADTGRSANTGQNVTNRVRPDNFQYFQYIRFRNGRNR